MGKKITKRQSQNHNKKAITKYPQSTDGEKVIWTFESIDKDGYFAFDLKREDFNLPEVFDKMLSYSTMTWTDVKKCTHDDGKSKHHIIDVDGFSQKAKERFVFMRLDENSDNIFSFALQNKLRIVGIRDGKFFRVLWYDPKHEIYPSRKK